ncbi:TPA: hypothetical protein HA239_00555 [Candidatus Woesearchaeota archaeon]|nr:hypothetical protein QT06_C0001G1204 [archaeon GW2011_AR15]MBS3104326.1 hypothetical protein [Candidatus Woesearchaeota archaeon]HIH40890.1 hypothetical protein [Candidatus Woesearchaeota archaeon]
MDISLLDRLLYRIDPYITLERRFVVEDQVRETEAVLNRSFRHDFYYLDNLKDDVITYNFLPIKNDADILLGLREGDRVKVFYSIKGIADFNYIPPDFKEKHQLEGRIYGSGLVRRLEKIPENASIR